MEIVFSFQILAKFIYFTDQVNFTHSLNVSISNQFPNSEFLIP